MTEPRRWLEDPQTSAEVRNVLEAAAVPPPLPPELNARLSEYAVGLASQGLLAKIGGASLWRKLLLSLGSSSKALVVVSTVAVAGAGAYGLHRERVSPPASRASHIASPLAAATVHEPPLPAVSATPTPIRSSVQPLEPGKPPAADAAARGTLAVAPSVVQESPSEPVPTSAGSPEQSIADEAKLLETARSFLGDSPALALELTEQHRRLHPEAQLSAEREFIAIDALLRLGRRQEAEKRAAPRLEQAPDSVYARRLRQLLKPATAAPSN